jgi:phage/plasmid primase-like uncharacterized protein
MDCASKAIIDRLPSPLNRILRNLTYAIIDLLGDGSSLSVRSSHPYEDGIYVFVQPIRGAKGNLLGYLLAVAGTTSLTLLSEAMADIRPEARVAVGLLVRLAARSGTRFFYFNISFTFAATVTPSFLSDSAVRCKPSVKIRYERRRQERERFEATADRLSGELRSLPSGVEKTAYHEAKGIEPLSGAPVRNGDLLVPGYGVDGKVWTIQYIKEDGTKRFARESRKHGCFHVIGAANSIDGLQKLRNSPVIAIAEGYATAATVAKYGNVPAVAAFDSGNLLAVATALHKRWPGKGIMIAGDDDHKLEDNPGRVKALEAAAAVNGVAIFPELSAEQREQGMTDFNDLGRALPEVVSRQLVATVNAAREGRTIRQAEKFRAADSTHPKEWLEIEKIRPIGFIGKDILAIEKKITEPSEIIKQNQGFEISRLLLNQPREQEQHPGIDR